MFNVPFSNSDGKPRSDPLEETKEHVEIPLTNKVDPAENAKAKLELPQKIETNLKSQEPPLIDQSNEINALTYQLKDIQVRLAEAESHKQ